MHHIYCNGDLYLECDCIGGDHGIIVERELDYKEPTIWIILDERWSRIRWKYRLKEIWRILRGRATSQEILLHEDSVCQLHWALTKWLREWNSPKEKGAE